jgi:hypothetical protein
VLVKVGRSLSCVMAIPLDCLLKLQATILLVTATTTNLSLMATKSTYGVSQTIHLQSRLMQSGLVTWEQMILKVIASSVSSLMAPGIMTLTSLSLVPSTTILIAWISFGPLYLLRVRSSVCGCTRILLLVAARVGSGRFTRTATLPVCLSHFRVQKLPKQITAIRSACQPKISFTSVSRVRIHQLLCTTRNWQWCLMRILIVCSRHSTSQMGDTVTVITFNSTDMVGLLRPRPKLTN